MANEYDIGITSTPIATQSPTATSSPESPAFSSVTNPIPNESTEDFLARIEALESSADEVVQTAINQDVNTRDIASEQDIGIMAQQKIYDLKNEASTTDGQANEDKTSQDSTTNANDSDKDVPNIKVDDDNINVTESNDTEVVKNDNTENADLYTPTDLELLSLIKEHNIKSKEDFLAIKDGWELSRENPLTIEQSKFVKDEGILNTDSLKLLTAIKNGNIKEAIKELATKNDIDLNELNIDEVGTLDEVDTPNIPSGNKLEDNYHLLITKAKKGGADDNYIVDNFLTKFSDDDDTFDSFLGNRALIDKISEHISNGAVETVNARIDSMKSMDYSGSFTKLGYMDQYIAASSQLHQEQVREQEQHQQVQVQVQEQRQQNNEPRAEIQDRQQQVVTEESIARRLDASHDTTRSSSNVEGNINNIHDYNYRQSMSSEEYADLINSIYMDY